MFVRCERCRAIYMLASAPGAVVACTRCPHVFETRELKRFSHGGTIGGAAAPIENAARWTPPSARKVDMREAASRAARPRAPLKKLEPPSKAPLVAGAVVVVVLAVFTVLAIRARHAVPELSPAMKQELVAAQAQLLTDDDVSLETAIAGFASLAARQPENPSFQAKRALATALLGAALKSEANDVSAELARLDRELFAVRDSDVPDKAVRVASLQDAEGDLRSRVAPASERADRLLREASELARKANEVEELPEAWEALALAAGNRAEDDRVNAALAHLPADDAWAVVARASLKMQGIVTPAKAGEARAMLSPAASAHPENLRLQVELARATSYAKAFDEAQALFEAVSRRNPAHEAAKRGLALVNAQRSPAP